MAQANLRRDKLFKSLCGIEIPIDHSIIPVSLSTDPIRKSSPYYIINADAILLKRKIDKAASNYQEQVLLYETARRTFDLAITELERKPTSQARISQLSTEVLVAQTHRDSSELEYADRMRQYNEILNQLEQVRHRVGGEVLDQASEYYTKLWNIKDQISVEDENIANTSLEISRQKNRYKGAMLRLEEVSNAIHSEEID